MNGIQNAFFGQQRRLLDFKSNGIFRDFCVYGELRAMRLPCEANLVCFKAFPYQISVCIDFPIIIVGTITMVFLLEKAITQQIIAANQYGCPDGTIVVLGNVYPFVPNAKNGSPCFLNIVVRVGYSVRIIRGASAANQSYVFAIERSRVFHGFHRPCRFFKNNIRNSYW